MLKEDLKAEKPNINAWKLLKSFFPIIALQEKQNFAGFLSVKNLSCIFSKSMQTPRHNVSFKSSLHFSKTVRIKTNADILSSLREAVTS